MTGTDPKDDLRRYLQAAREALLRKLDGVGEYDVRRPLVPTGTNLLGLVKHVASIESGYFGETFGWPRTPTPARTCGPPPTSRGSRSSPCTGGSGRTRTPPSRRPRWTPPAGCRGGRRSAPRSPCTGS